MIADSGEKRAGAAKDVMSTVVMLLKVYGSFQLRVFGGGGMMLMD